MGVAELVKCSNAYLKFPVIIGDMCGSKAAKYLSQAHFCPGESEVEIWASIFGDDKPSSTYAHYAF